MSGVSVGPHDLVRGLLGELGVERDDRGHQLGERGDRQRRVRVLAEEDLAGVLVDDQRRLRLQRRLAQLARERRRREDRQGDQACKEDPHPPSKLRIGLGSVVSVKAICKRK